MCAVWKGRKELHDVRSKLLEKGQSASVGKFKGPWTMSGSLLVLQFNVPLLVIVISLPADPFVVNGAARWKSEEGILWQKYLEFTTEDGSDDLSRCNLSNLMDNVYKINAMEAFNGLSRRQPEVCHQGTRI